MKKIMFVIGGLATGGAERVLTSVSSELAAKGYNITLLTYYSGDNEYPYSDKINRINLSGGTFNEYAKMSFISKIKRIRKYIKNEKPDHIICFLPHSYVLTYLSTTFTKYKKRISTAIRANPKVEMGKIAKLHKKFSKKAKRIITQNSGQATCFNENLQHKIRVIPNPMYKELFENEKVYNKELLKIVSVGRLTSQKNYDLALNAFEKVHKLYPNINYYIYGKGDKEEYLKEKINQLNLQDNVFLMGFEKDRNVIYGDKDIYLMTSKFEGMPNTLAEAMCYGIPSISTNCEFGPADLIQNKDMGILLEKDDVDSVSNAIIEMIENYGEYISKAVYAKNILKEKYNFDKVIQKWIDFIEEE